MVFEPAPEPEIGVEQVEQRSTDQPGEWIVTWRIENLTSGLLVVEAAWLPHGQFRGDRTDFDPAVTLNASETTDLPLLVRCPQNVELVVENAFLILTVQWRDQPWRILTRLTVRMEADGAPTATTETMTIQPVGFSGVEAP